MARTINIYALSIILFFLGGCATSQRTIVPKQNTFDIPALNQVTISELGDTIVSKGKLYSYEAIDLLNQVQAGDGFFLIKFTIPPQQLIAKLEDDDWIYYQGDNVTSFDAVVGTLPAFGGLKFSKVEKGKIVLFGNVPAVTFAPKPEPQFEHITINAFDKPGFKQELIYNGRTGNDVKFLYRELSSSTMRAPFSQEVQYDLKESKEIGFKGVRIEIVEATNTQLTYRVMSSFPDPQ